jgi:glycerophosphoryl diester phosphodiesterase
MTKESPFRSKGFFKIAHRGASGAYPENTPIAFEKAIESGADLIELDCHMTKDGHIAVIHDATLKRTTTGRGLVKTKTLNQLKTLDAGSWFHSDFRNQKIPTLEEALDLTHGRAGLIIEIKNQPYVHLGIELRILFLLYQAEALGRAIVSSQDYFALRRLRELSGDVRIGLLMTAEEREDPLRVAKELGAFALLIRKDLFCPLLLRETKRRGLKALVWTVNEPGEIQRYASMGVGGILTDFPDRLSSLANAGSQNG